MMMTCSSSVPLLVALTLSGGPPQVGQWQPPMKWDVVAIHAATLPTGEVLHWAYPDPTDFGSRARLWDPATGRRCRLTQPSEAAAGRSQESFSKGPSGNP